MNKIGVLLLIIILSSIALRPLFYSGFFPLHDSTHVARVYEMTQALKDGQFPARWVSDLGYGYGYPLFNFYAPLPYYVGSIFNLTAFNSLLSTKLMFGIGIVLSGIFMYAFVYQIFRSMWGSLFASMLYVYAPYHGLDIYVRGAVGEFWAMALIPLLCTGLYSSFSAKTNKDYLWAIIIGGIGFGGIILSHNITGMLTGMFLLFFYLGLIIYVLWKKRGLKSLLTGLMIVSLGLGLSAFFWLPAIDESSYTSVSELITGGSNFRDHFVYLDQLWASPWGFGGSAPGRLDGLSFMVGKVHIALSFILILLVILKSSLGRQYKVLLGVFLTLGVTSIYLMIDYSRVVWEAFPALALVQFPWRFLVFTTFAVSVIPAFLVAFVPPRYQSTIFFLLCLGIIRYNGKYFQPKAYISQRSEDFTNSEELQWNTSRISDEYLPMEFKRPLLKDEIRGNSTVINSHGSLNKIRRTSKVVEFELVNSVDERVQLALTYFPGWRVLRNGQEIAVQISEGKIVLPAVSGKWFYRVELVNTAIRTIANTISLIAAVCFGGIIYAYKKVPR